MISVRLIELDEAQLARLLEAAVADADPLEVMPPVDGPDGWNDRRRQAFLEFHRGRSIGTDHPVETTYVIEVDDQVIGAARLESTGDDVEAGVWIGRSWRGRGAGRLVAAELLAMARKTGAARFIASTTAGNSAARKPLGGIGAGLTTDGDDVEAALELKA
ncbi:GNAT family N-acetyltransferase [Amycolatopsis sp.]|jgi:RimJ/RimL family protein N-acetyltransferase|uniref:GNAT family N-acetyltransferase n=1 Tax=Amycolatopsis sp. TaxID=37632 RepID=UPI002E067C23|nr:GNAT family N-acetyltransferase [Amycolatopsis sp.]